MQATTPLHPQTQVEMETISPNIYVRDLDQTISFYRLLGFEVITRFPEDQPIFVLMQCGSLCFMFQTFESIGNTLPAVRRNDGGSLLLYIKVKGVRRLFDKISNLVTIVNGLEKTFYGAIEFSILDNNNYMLTFAEDE